MYAPIINYAMKSEVATVLCSTHCTVLQTNNSVGNFFAMNSGRFREKHDKASGKPYHAISNQHLVLSAKRIGTQRRTKVAP